MHLYPHIYSYFVTHTITFPKMLFFPHNSSHSAEKKDRLWGISCKAFEVTRTCRWSPYVNEYWGSMNFKCADNEVIAGAYSKHSNIFEDRK